MNVRLTYNLTGHGWADCDIVAGGQEAHLTASYLSDALDDLAAAGVDLLRGADQAVVTFEEEPGWFRWRFHRRDPDVVRIQIYQMLTEADKGMGPDGALIFDTETEIVAFGRLLLDELDRIRLALGLEGYKKQWILYEFPAERQDELRTLLRNQPQSFGGVGA